MELECTVYGPLRGATGEKTVTVEFGGGTVRDALAAFVAAYPRAESQLFDEEGAVRPSVRVALDGDRVVLDARCRPDAALAIYPAMRGGRR
ncbi:molybdopterin synthase sulfur carrier subunit [Halobacteriales archaeon QS_5_70_17]|nr:MAG: molybdopterin synthase sulfur carrier subunit [Halobacteriales archaeon QS_5_70_17]